MSNHFLNKYLSVICFCSLRDIGVYQKGCSKKKGMLRTRFFQLIRCLSSILKRKKCGVNHDIVKIGQQMLKFQKILKFEIRILSSPIFIFSIKSKEFKNQLYIRMN